MQMRNDSERFYRQRLERWKERSDKIMTNALNRNQTYQNHLKYVIGDLEQRREIQIQESHEKIWNVSHSECPKPRLPRQKNTPSYLADPKIASLPTPSELASLLPKKVTKSKPEMSRQYTRLSMKKLSQMDCDQMDIRHYRSLLDANSSSLVASDNQQTSDQSPEQEFEETLDLRNEASDHEKTRGPPPRSSTIRAMGRRKHIAFAEKPDNMESVAEASNGDDDVDEWTSAWLKQLEELRSASRKYDQQELLKNATDKMKPSPGRSSCRPVSCPPALRQSSGARQVSEQIRPKSGPSADRVTKNTSVDNKPSGKVWKNSYVGMFNAQVEKHKTRMVSGTKENEPATLDKMQKNESPSVHRRLVHGKLAKGNGERSQNKRKNVPQNKGPVKHSEPGTQSNLLRPTASSSQRGVDTRAMFRRVKNALASVNSPERNDDQGKAVSSSNRSECELDASESLEDGELFQSMRKCRYLRWGKDEARVEELNADTPLGSNVN